MSLRVPALAAAVLTSALLLAACGDDSSSSDQATDTGVSASESRDYAATLEKLYKGEFTPPPTAGAPAQKGKKVWYISCGQAAEACADSSAAFQEASKELGWNTTIIDSKVNFANTAAAIRRAIAAKVDAVVPFAADCSQITSALEEAKAAGLPVVTAFASDCGEDGQAGEPLFTANMLIKGLPHGEYREAWGKARAEYTIAKTEGRANVIDAAEQTFLNQRLQHASFQEAIRACAGCELNVLKYTFADAGPKVTAKLTASLAQHPDADVVSVGNDFIAAVGVAQAVQQSGKAGKLMVVGGDGGATNWDLIRQGVQTASVPYSYQWGSWSLADLLNRHFAGESTDDVDEGGGWQAVDADHNLPAEGERWDVPIDYRSAYKKIWAGG